MGDDLIFAQKFTRTAADGLALLVEMDNPRAPQDASVVIDMMTTVQRGAKRLRARHIYSGAQGVLSALHHDNDATLTGRIENLGSLVTEYARGLDEVLQASEAPPARTDQDKWDAARETLNALLPTASTNDADMLSRLMRAPVTLDAVHPSTASVTTHADILPFTSVEIQPLEDATPAKSLETPIVSEMNAPTPPLENLDASLSVTLDAMMRDVIADALSVARSVGRTISLSYDMGDKAVSDELAADLRNRLGQTLSQIIRQSLTDDRVGHIDINLAGEQLHIMAGTTAVRLAINPKSAPKAKPLITAETEKGLRAQLTALMDPISLQDTAS